MSLLRRWMPSPGLSAILLVLWLLLARSASVGQILVAIALAIGVPLLASNLRLQVARVRHPRVAAAYVLTVIRDVVQSNLAVALDVLRWRGRRPSPAFVLIPLDLRDPVGLAVLAMVTTIVPGTVWSELAPDRSTLLLHAWDVADENAFVARFKARYEQPLRAIFE